VTAHDLGEHDEFMLGEELPVAAGALRSRHRGGAARGGTSLAPATIEVRGELPPGAGLSSSAALEVALCLALLELADRAPAPPLTASSWPSYARVENRWVGAQTGLLDQIACLFGAADHAVLIDFRSL
jgi:galactokinase